jgi:hypothetical protein
MVVTATLLLLAPLLDVRAGGDEEMVINPMYKSWANFKPGSISSRLEVTVFGEGGGGKSLLPDGTDEKIIVHKLLTVSPDNVVVEVLVAEKEFLGVLESAPTRMVYPAKIKKAHLQAALLELDAKKGEESLMVLGKKLECKTIFGTVNREGSTIEHKVWYSDMIPGGVVKRSRTTSQDGKVVAKTTILLKSYKAAD